MALDADKVNAFGCPSMQPGFDPAQHPFHIGTLGMQITGDWEIGADGALRARTSTTASPGCRCRRPATSPYTWAGGWSVVIPQGAKNVDEAWRRMQVDLRRPDGGRIYTKQSHHVPVYAALYEEKDLFSERHQFFLQTDSDGQEPAAAAGRPEVLGRADRRLAEDLPEPGSSRLICSGDDQGSGQRRSAAVLPAHRADQLLGNVEAVRRPARWRVHPANHVVRRGPDRSPPSI